MPMLVSMATSRRGTGGAAARLDGSKDSSHGKASVTPAPRRKVRSEREGSGGRGFTKVFLCECRPVFGRQAGPQVGLSARIPAGSGADKGRVIQRTITLTDNVPDDRTR